MPSFFMFLTELLFKTVILQNKLIIADFQKKVINDEKYYNC